MVRAFAALPLPDAHRAALEHYLDRCAAIAPAFRWVAADGLHLTLRFAGNLEDEVASRLRESLRAVRRAPFELRLGGVGSFGGRRAAVVWLGLTEGAEPAAELAAACEVAARAAGLEPEPRPFRAHVTLARARDRRGAPLPDLPPPPELPGWRAGGFVLFRSQLHGSRPPDYVPIERYALEA